MDISTISSIGAAIAATGAGVALWKPISSALISMVTNNRAGGEVITQYKEQVLLLKENNDQLRKENNELRERREKDLQRIAALEGDIRLVKHSLSLLIKMNEVGLPESFRGQVTSVLAKLEDGSNEF